VRIHSHKSHIGCHKFGADAPGVIEMAPTSQVFMIRGTATAAYGTAQKRTELDFHQRWSDMVVWALF